LAVVLVFGFTQLPFRIQGRAIEIVTFGDWPLEWAVRRQFERNQPELRSIIEFVNEQPEVVGLTVTPVGLRASLAENKGVDHNLDQPNILQALISIEAKLVNVHDDRVSVFLGSEVRGSTSFEASYIYPSRSLSVVDCDGIGADDRPKIGSCAFQLSAQWYALYQWYPDDPAELEKAIDELK
jgi:hypothetical protein